MLLEQFDRDFAGLAFLFGVASLSGTQLSRRRADITAGTGNDVGKILENVRHHSQWNWKKGSYLPIVSFVTVSFLDRSITVDVVVCLLRFCRCCCVCFCYVVYATFG